MARRKPEAYNWDRLQFDETILTKHFTSPRREKIQFVVIHHMAMVGRGDGLANDSCYQTWQTREASAHYGIDGKFVRQFVWDSDAAWATANGHGNHAGISIEHANSTAKPNWLVSDETLATSARLVANLHRMYKLGRPVAGKTLFRHRDFYSTECPGPYLAVKHWDTYVAACQTAYDGLVATPPTPSPEPPQEVPVALHPADVFGTGWKYTSPELFGGHAREILQPELATYASQWLRTASDGHSAIFKVNHGGATTSGSKNPRSELREMTKDGRKIYNWDGRRGHHRMEVVEAVNHLTVVKPHVVTAQIHTATDDLTVLRHEGIKGTNRMNVWLTKGDNTHALHVDEIELTERFKFAFDVADGRVHFEWNDKVLPFTVPASAGSYFRCGAYLQSNPETAPGESKSAYSEVRLFSKPLVIHS